MKRLLLLSCMILSTLFTFATDGYVKVTSSDGTISWVKIQLEYKYNGNEYKVSSYAIDKETEGALDLDNVWSSSGGTGKQYRIIEIDYNAFYFCSKITSVNCTSTSFYVIHSGAFYGCISLQNVNIPFVQLIENQAFSNCTMLTSVTFEGIWPTGNNNLMSMLYRIEDYAFSYCSSLTSFHIPARLKAIGKHVFSYCSNLSSITVDSSNEYFTFEDGLLMSKDKTILYRCLPACGLTTCDIPSTITSINEEAFLSCSSISSVYVNIDNPISISSNTFSYANKMNLFVPQNSIELYRNADGWKNFYNIEGYDFSYQFGKDQTFDVNYSFGLIRYKVISAINKTCEVFLEFTDEDDGDVIIPSYIYGYKVIGIGNGAFSEEKDMESITIPPTIEYIGKDAFEEGGYVPDVYISDLEAWCNIIFENNESAPTRARLWLNGTIITDLVVPNSITKINNYAFYGCSELKSVTIPNSVTSIGDGAFWSCSGLTSVTIPNSVTSIGDRVFSGCYGLTSVTIPNSVTSIGGSAFFACSGLTSMTIPNSVTSIGDGAFSCCNGLTSLTVAPGCATFDSRNNCNAIIKTSSNTLIAGCKNTTIPNSVTSIGNSAFNYCSSLTSIIIPNSVTSIGNSAFYYCSGLTSITIPKSVTSIGGNAFYKCSAITSVTIPNSVTNIGDNAFSGCSSLTSVTVGMELPVAITKNVFTTRYNATLYVPRGCKAVYEVADYWKEFKEIIEVDNRNSQTLDYVSIPAMTYGDASYTLPQKTTEGLTLTWSVNNSAVASISGNVLSIVGTGTATVMATQTGNDSYKPFSRDFTLTVDKAALTITADDYMKEEGEDNPELTVSYSGFKYNDDASSLTTLPTITTTATKDSPAGSYPITVSDAASSNYEFTYVNGTLTIIEKTVTASCSLFVEATSLRCGSQAELPVCFESEASFGGLQCEVTLPAGITLDKLTKTDRLGDDFVLQKSKTGENTYQILLYNTSRQSFAGTDGALFMMTVTVDDNMAEGDYTLSFSDIVASGVDESQEDLPDFSVPLHVEKYLTGDANRDNRVNVTDIMAVANYILKIASSNFNEKVADVNGDSRVNVTDIMGIANIILKVNTTQNVPARIQMLDPQ